MRPVCSEDSDRNVDEKDRTPSEELDENTAQSIAGDCTSVDCDLVYPDSLSQSFASKSVCHDRDAVDEEKCSADSLNKPERQELLCSEGEPGEKRADSEYGEAEIVHPDPTIQVRNSPNPNQEDGYHEPVDRDEPYTNNQVGVQRSNYLRKTHDKNARVERRHENPDSRDGENYPLVLQQQTAQITRVSGF